LGDSEGKRRLVVAYTREQLEAIAEAAHEAIRYAYMVEGETSPHIPDALLEKVADALGVLPYWKTRLK
jgi:hypothetical protein